MTEVLLITGTRKLSKLVSSVTYVSALIITIKLCLLHNTARVARLQHNVSTCAKVEDIHLILIYRQQDVVLPPISLHYYKRKPSRAKMQTQLRCEATNPFLY